MNVDIRRPPIADKPMAVIPDESRMQQPISDYKPTPQGRSVSTRMPQDVASPQPQDSVSSRPPAEGWECNSCGFLNDGNRLYCESCSSAYSSQLNNQSAMQRQPVSGMNYNQTLYQNQPTYKPPDAYPSRQVTQPPAVQTRNFSNIVNTFDLPGQSAAVTPQQQLQTSPRQSPSRNAAQQAKVLESQRPGGMSFGTQKPPVATKPKVW